jgi:hypothetical protein
MTRASERSIQTNGSGTTTGWNVGVAIDGGKNDTTPHSWRKHRWSRRCRHHSRRTSANKILVTIRKDRRTGEGDAAAAGHERHGRRTAWFSVQGGARGYENRKRCSSSTRPGRSPRTFEGRLVTCTARPVDAAGHVCTRPPGSLPSTGIPTRPYQLYHVVLSDAVRNDIHFEVDYHFYVSLKTSFCVSLTAFFNKILLPLIESPMPASAPSERANRRAASVFPSMTSPWPFPSSPSPRSHRA